MVSETLHETVEYFKQFFAVVIYSLLHYVTFFGLRVKQPFQFENIFESCVLSRCPNVFPHYIVSITVRKDMLKIICLHLFFRGTSWFINKISWHQNSLCESSSNNRWSVNPEKPSKDLDINMDIDQHSSQTPCRFPKFFLPQKSHIYLLLKYNSWHWVASFVSVFWCGADLSVQFTTS